MARPVTCSLASLLMLLSLGGCAQNRTHELAPPPGGAQVHFSIKVPPDLAANPMRVMYRSAKCPATRSGADWTTYEEDGRHAIEVLPQRQGNSDLYVADLAVDGGGACQWQLSNVTFGVDYGNTSRFGADVKSGGGAEIILIFDENLPQQRSMYPPEIVNGDLTIKQDYYPWISESFLIRHEQLSRLFGNTNSFITYKVKQARNVTFEPVLHADYVVYSEGPKVKREGNYTRFTYPDGSVVADGDSKPDFRKLEAIRQGRQP
ncbi:hypothetical protein A6723_020440 [Pseudomonas sp. AU11447]|uniref:hypothetical protein n=1 Tax=unclassified Pseudomonas TaxID=196821 RepID=UPI0006D3FA7F|nr:MULTISPECIES: hypothetical protein [unclassified Pseudomonas]OBY90675.1 hypothetical protein A6723_020440 [Pseudomonas sp. AU11447]